MNWYAVFVKTGKEEVVRERIRLINDFYYPEVECKILVPKRKMLEYKAGKRYCVTRLLFPSYVLIGTDQIRTLYEQIKTNREDNIVRFLRTDDYFQKISKNEMNSLTSLINEDGLIGVSEVFVENDKVSILNGPLKNFKGIIKKIDRRKGRAKIQVDFLNRQCMIDIAIRCIEKCDDQFIKNRIYFSFDGYGR